ncbi:hypothetical protein RAJCM14343_3949 [Rhodococcus aetherivorans]|uniref:Phage protein n=1 Tax=Rhodococcus aetherivorans TaxID=191292 RepID=A0ABQ0YQE7_9NOCA|nr:hypothetical protein [Rhodococcus aetherivorans]ETT25266.1 hypothetical protein RR21198_4006 [Rhodococcus rhodochrous ATCC 21198]NGP28461.1 hypothetical protein [Rhodococcus aetherivorans]GES38684.1 hypothetical protein RAJCM14343_3949 [Rhodococcus aetherivorans]
MALQTSYNVELWTRAGQRICDITHLAKKLYWEEERNEAERLTFSLNLDAFEDYLINKVGADPVSNFREGQTEIKIRENGDYLFGTQLYYAPIDIGADDITISVTATGYLNFFKDRYPDPAIAYSNEESVDIFFGLVQQAQAVPYGDYGIIIPASGYYVTGKLRDRTYENYTSSTKLNMQRLTNLVDGKFDFRFLPDKTLMTYAAVGSPRTDFKLTFDREHDRSSIDSGRLNRGANNLYNQVIGQGSGLGDDMITSIKEDEPSQNEFGLRQLPVQFNEVKESTTLDENAQAELDRRKRLLRMPQITLSAADLPAVRIEVGDIIPIQMKGRKLLEDITGLYRIERKECHVDDNHFLEKVTLYFEKTGEYSA